MFDDEPERDGSGAADDSNDAADTPTDSWASTGGGVEKIQEAEQWPPPPGELEDLERTEF